MSFFAGKGRGYHPDPPVVCQRRLGFHELSVARALGAKALPLSTNNRQFLPAARGGPGILDQHVTSACEGHAHASGVTLRFALVGTPIPLASPICPYVGARMIARQPRHDGTLPPLLDEGTEPSLVIQAMQQWGIASAARWGNYPADPATINQNPTLDQLESAGEFRLAGAYFIQSRGDAFLTALMTALASGYVCTTAIAASSPAFNDYRGGVLGALDDDIDHASLWVDYSWDGKNLSSLVIYGVNSWGDGTQGDPAWGESDVPGIAAGMYRGNRDFADKYSQDCAVLDVKPLAGGRLLA